MLKGGLNIAFRPMEQSERSLVFSSWIRAYRESQANFRIVDSVYFPMMSERIEDILDRSECVCAHFPETPEEVCGYIIADEDVVHWVYVKYPYRRIGIADNLFASRLARYKTLYCSHMPKLSSSGHAWSSRLFEELGDRLLYNPSLQYKRRAA